MEEDESTSHILSCKYEDAKRIWKESLWKFFEYLVTIGTDIQLLFLVKRDIFAWREGQELPVISEPFTETDRVILAQQNIGWRAFLMGYW